MRVVLIAAGLSPGRRQSRRELEGIGCSLALQPGASLDLDGKTWGRSWMIFIGV